eukprot:8003896-Pyramimonas_sp.AAC.1
MNSRDWDMSEGGSLPKVRTLRAKRSEARTFRLGPVRCWEERETVGGSLSHTMASELRVLGRTDAHGRVCLSLAPVATL